MQGGTKLKRVPKRVMRQRRQHAALLEDEWQAAAKRRVASCQVNERVKLRVRRPTRYDGLARTAVLHPAKVVRGYPDDTYDIVFLNQGRESENRIARRYIVRAGEKGFPVAAKDKPDYLKTTAETLRERWGLPEPTLKQELKQLDATRNIKTRVPWNGRHTVDGKVVCGTPVLYSSRGCCCS